VLPPLKRRVEPPLGRLPPFLQSGCPINSLGHSNLALFGISNNAPTDTVNDGEMAISFPVRLGRRLSELREKHGLSQTQLADMAGIGRAHLSQIENGAVAVRIDTLYALAQALDLKLEELLKGF
jgi:DNA-binding XRE family transcriptional regulator